MTRCALCGEPDAEHTGDEATVYNESGGVPSAICSDCRAELLKPRCTVCGDRCSGDRGIAFLTGSEEPVTADVCPDCRREIPSENGGELR